MNQKNILYTILVPITLLLWGTEYTLIGFIGEQIAESWQVAVRLCGAAIIMTAIVYKSGQSLPPLSNKAWIWYGLMGFVGMTAPFYLIARGSNSGVDSGLLSILIGVAPLITVVLAHFFIKSEPLTRLKSLGFVIGFFGTVFLFLPDDLSWGLVKNWQGQLLVLLAAAGYAATSIIGKRAPNLPATTGAAIMLIGGGATALIGALGTGVPKTLPPPPALLALAALTLGATALGNFLYLRLLQLSGPSLIAKLNYLVPFIALMAGTTLLGEPFKLRYALALGIILLGLMIARLGEKIPKET